MRSFFLKPLSGFWKNFAMELVKKLLVLIKSCTGHVASSSNKASSSRQQQTSVDYDPLDLNLDDVTPEDLRENNVLIFN